MGPISYISPRLEMPVKPTICWFRAVLKSANDDLIGAPGEIRTPDLLVRSQALYPTELRAQLVVSTRKLNHFLSSNCPVWLSPGGGILP
jgi:hypothetical protein